MHIRRGRRDESARGHERAETYHRGAPDVDLPGNLLLLLVRQVRRLFEQPALRHVLGQDSEPKRLLLRLALHLHGVALVFQRAHLHVAVLMKVRNFRG